MIRICYFKVCWVIIIEIIKIKIVDSFLEEMIEICIIEDYK